VSGLYFIQEDGQLVEMKEELYDSEDLLQRLLARYPNLLAGDRLEGDTPQRLLLVSREVGLPSEVGGVNRWSVDHLFLDQDAIPTLVEVKRSSDTRIRREVVGQMLDYAANAIVYWPVETIRASFEERCRVDGVEIELALEDFLHGGDQDEFWEKVKTNLQAGKIRLVFVADVIPIELQRIVEFLNTQMDPATVLAVEIRQYTGRGLKTLVPRVIGQTAEAQRKKHGSTGKGRQLDETSFLQLLEAAQGSKQVEVVRKIQQWARDKLPRFVRELRGRYGIFWPCLDHKKIPYFPIGIRTDGKVEVTFQYLRMKPPFDDEAKLRDLLGRFNEIKGVHIPPHSINGRPTFSLAVLEDEDALEQFFAALVWLVQEIKAT